MQQLPHSVRVKIKNVDHYLALIAELKEYGIQCNVGAENIYELDMRRVYKKSFKKEWFIYISYNRVLSVFRYNSVVRNVPEMKRKELIKWLSTQ